MEMHWSYNTFESELQSRKKYEQNSITILPLVVSLGMS